MDIILFDKVCIYDADTNKTILYGQYSTRFNKIHVEGQECPVVFNNSLPDFYMKLTGKVTTIDTLRISYAKDEKILSNITLTFPFEDCDLALTPSSAIISTLCKQYGHRLDEWIQYNLKLGFSGIVVFDNDANTANALNESTIGEASLTTNEVCNKYKGRVLCVQFPYAPFSGKHWNTVQRISLHIGVNAFRKRCRNIALIDADEFIYLPKNPSMSIETFLSNYSTVTMRSNILTNKNKDDVLDNNILQLAVYVGRDLYTKTILHTQKIVPNEFLMSPHTHRTQTVLKKTDIIHYHCWMNDRCKWDASMPQIDFLKPV